MPDGDDALVLLPKCPLRFSVFGGFLMPGLARVAPGALEEPRQSSTLTEWHYDTSDLRLIRAGGGVRFIEGDGAGRWTVAFSHAAARAVGPVLSNGELHLLGCRSSIPSEVSGLVRSMRWNRPLQLVARLETRRSKVVVTAAGNPPVSVHDDEISVFHGDRLTERFREIEVVARCGDPLTHAIVDRLREAGVSEWPAMTRMARALGPRATKPADPAVTKQKGRVSAGDAVTYLLATGLRTLLDIDPSLRLAEGAENVGRARAAVMRMRADLSNFSPLLEPGRIRELRSELCWLDDILGRRASTDMLNVRLAKHCTGLSSSDAEGAAGLLEQLHHDRAESGACLAAALDSDRYSALLEELGAVVLDPPFLQIPEEQRQAKDKVDEATKAPQPVADGKVTSQNLPPLTTGAVGRSSFSAVTSLRMPPPIPHSPWVARRLKVQAPAPSNDGAGEQESVTESAPRADAREEPQPVPAPTQEMSPKSVQDPLQDLVTVNHRDVGRRATRVLPVLAARTWMLLAENAHLAVDETGYVDLESLISLADMARWAAIGTAEFVGSEPMRMANGLERALEALTDMADAAESERWLRSHLAGRAHGEAFVAGLLVGMEHVQMAKARRRFGTRWAAVESKRNRRWME